MKTESLQKIKILKNGPYQVKGGVPLDELRIVCDPENNAVAYEQTQRYTPAEPYFLCRCGHSAKKPYCDGAHVAAGFNGEETATHEPYVRTAKYYNGKFINMRDDEKLCAVARFCDTYGTTWHLVSKSKTPVDNTIVISQCNNCPSGRLTAISKDGTVHEPELPREISLLDDPAENVQGPIWVKGGIPVEGADGKTYEIRNRITLCRCGRSTNKPFCDAKHVEE